MSTTNTVSNMKFDAIVFDLDRTLFDNEHTGRQAMSAVTKEFPVLLQQHNLDHLIMMYARASTQVYEEYMSKRINRENMKNSKLDLFFVSLGLKPLEPAEADRFRSIHRPAYAESRIATPGSVETLQRLRDSGFRLAILTNSWQAVQENKASKIGVRHLVEHLVSSEAVGYSKPDRRIFDHVTKLLGVDAQRTLMVGDNMNADIEGALGAGWSAVLYQPSSKSSSCRVKGHDVSVISNMTQLLELVTLESPTSSASGVDA